MASIEADGAKLDEQAPKAEHLSRRFDDLAVFHEHYHPTVHLRRTIIVNITRQPNGLHTLDRFDYTPDVALLRPTTVFLLHADNREHDKPSMWIIATLLRNKDMSLYSAVRRTACIQRRQRGGFASSLKMWVYNGHQSRIRTITSSPARYAYTVMLGVLRLVCLLPMRSTSN